MANREKVSLFALSCHEASRLASEALDRELTSRERWAHWIHTRTCGLCWRFAAQMTLIRAWVQALPEAKRNQAFRKSVRLSSTRRREIKRLLIEAMQSDA